MPSVLQYLGQGAFYALAAAFTGYLSLYPTYQQVPADKAQVKLSFAHGAHRVEACRRLTPKEIAALPPKERRPNTCSRERTEIFVELFVNGELLYSESLQPTGLSRDGPARTYRKFLVPAGNHTIKARLRDSTRDSGFDYETERRVELAPLQNLAVDFKADRGGFVFR